MVSALVIQLCLLYLLHTVEAGLLSKFSYAPKYSDCPDRASFVRHAVSISSEEQQWLQRRNKVSQRNLYNFLKWSTTLPESDYKDIIPLDGSDESIKIGVSFSGGGFRALLCGAGELSALDNRTEGAAEHGLGGILQSATYLAGTSGGNWLVGSLALNNWSSVPEIVNHGIWNFDTPLYEKHTFKDTYKVWKNWIHSVQQKRAAGFRVSIVDIWARALVSKLLPIHTTEDATWSSIRNVNAFQNAEMPFPMSISLAKYNAYGLDISNSTVMEANPFEFGSWDPSGETFTDMRYVGTKYVDGVPTNNKKCVTDFDNAGFIMAASSNIWDLGVEGISQKVEEIKILVSLTKNMFKEIGRSLIANSIIDPNPFFLTSWGKSFWFKNRPFLALVDGGQDLQNIPFSPLITDNRDVDVILSYDNSADTSSLWPNGTSLTYTYQRQFLENGKGSVFPPVPSESEYMDRGLYLEPMFLGCYHDEMKHLSRTPPIVVYTPNSRQTFNSNFSTMKMAYDDHTKKEMIRNGFAAATSKNLTGDPHFRDCIGCAIIRRKQERNGIKPSERCESCFDRYCYSQDQYSKSYFEKSFSYTRSASIIAANASSQWNFKRNSLTE